MVMSIGFDHFEIFEANFVSRPFGDRYYHHRSPDSELFCVLLQLLLRAIRAHEF
jgi:hypothetical protein